jgi:enterochelin esterase-like enzyme
MSTWRDSLRAGTGGLRRGWAVLLAGSILAGCTASSAVQVPPKVTPTWTPPAPSPSPAPATPEASPTPACTEERGTIERTAYPGAVVESDVPVLVYLPPCYAFADRRYPVLIALHGYPYDESHWEDLGLLAAAEAAAGSGDFAPLILVLPRQPEPLFRRTDGGPGSYEQELLEGLVPFLETSYRTAPHPDAWTLAGISRGGVWALEIGLRHPEVFNSVAGLSAALSLNAARPMYDPLVFVGAAERLPSRVYLMAGDADWARATTEQLDAMLRGRGVSSTLDVRPGAHADATWQPVMADVLRFAAAGAGP